MKIHLVKNLRLVVATVVIIGVIAGIEIFRLRSTQLPVRLMLDVLAAVLLALTVGTWCFGWSWWKRINRQTGIMTAKSVLFFALICAVQEETTVVLLKIVLMLPAAIILCFAVQDITKSLKNKH